MCKDNVPAQCPKMKRYCGSAKYEKVLKQKCSLTCGFCTADGSAPTQAPAASGKLLCRFSNRKKTFQKNSENGQLAGPSATVNASSTKPESACKLLARRRSSISSEIAPLRKTRTSPRAVARAQLSQVSANHI